MCRSSYVVLQPMSDRPQRFGNSSFFMLFQGAFGLPIAFWTSLEGSVIEMKSVILAPQDTAVSLKAYVAS